MQKTAMPDEWEKERKKRLRNLRSGCMEVFLLGFGYYLFTEVTHWYIPCLVRMATGCLCPGCGVSHMFTALFHLDIRTAYHANPFVFTLLPIILLYGLYRAGCYVNDTKSGYDWWEIVAFTLAFVAAIVFAVYRNISLGIIHF